MASVTERPRHTVPFPMNRPTDQVIAERMLAAALHNYHKACTSPSGNHDFMTWDQMTDEQRAFYVDWAIPQAMQTIWK